MEFYKDILSLLTIFQESFQGSCDIRESFTIDNNTYHLLILIVIVTDFSFTRPGIIRFGVVYYGTAEDGSFK